MSHRPASDPTSARIVADIHGAGGGPSAEELSPLDRSRGSRRTPPWALLIAGVAHALFGLVVVAVPEDAPLVASVAPAQVTRWVEVALPVQKVLPPEPEAEPQPPKPQRAARPRSVKPRPKTPEPPPEPESLVQEPAPEAAAAPDVLTQAPAASSTPAAPQVVSGQSAAMVGGQSAGAGTAQEPVRSGQAQVGGVLNARGSASANRARPPRLAGGSQWDCPWPEEGDMVDEDEPTVTLRVQVTSSGQVRKVTVVEDPGYGFGQEARRCAMRKRWQPALDPAGRPTENVALVAVRFRS